MTTLAVLTGLLGFIAGAAAATLWAAWCYAEGIDR